MIYNIYRENTCFLIIEATQNSNAFGQNKFKSGKHKTAITQLQKLTGTWRLIEFADLDSATSKWKYPYVKNPKGYFTYIKSGIVNLNISADTALKISEHSIKNYSINLLNWANNFHYVILEPTHLIIINQLTHHVKGGSLPWYIDTDQPRPFVLKGDTLIIGDSKKWKRVLVKTD